MGKYGNLRCNNCGIIRPGYRMRKTEISYKSGKSGYSFSFHPFANLGSKSSNKIFKSIRIHSGRSYKRNRLVWVCESQMACHKPNYYDFVNKPKEFLKKNKNIVDEPKNEKLNQIFKQKNHFNLICALYCLYIVAYAQTDIKKEKQFIVDEFELKKKDLDILKNVLNNEDSGSIRASINAIEVKKFYRKKSILKTIIEAMMYAACINLELTDKELKLVEDVANVFEINKVEYNDIKNLYKSTVL